MAVRVRVRVTKNRLPKIAAIVQAGIGDCVRETLTEIEQDVKGGAHAAPYQTGNLRRSYHQEMTGPHSGTVGNDPSIAHYAPYVEFGTHRAPAQPHLIPAAEAALPGFVERLTRLVKGAA